MSDQEEYTMPPWGTSELLPQVGLGQTDPTLAPDQIPTGPTTAPAAPAPIVVSTPAVAPVVVQPKQGVSFSAMVLIAAGSALLGGVLVWMFAGNSPKWVQTHKGGPLVDVSKKRRRNPNKEHWGPGDQYVYVPPRSGKKKKKKRARR